MVRINWSRMNSLAGVITIWGYYNSFGMVCYQPTLGDHGSYELDADTIFTIAPRDPAFAWSQSYHDCCHEKVDGTVDICSHPRWSTTPFSFPENMKVVQPLECTPGMNLTLNLVWESHLEGKRSETDVTIDDFQVLLRPDGSIGSYRLHVSHSEERGYRLLPSGEWQYQGRTKHAKVWVSTTGALSPCRGPYVKQLYAHQFQLASAPSDMNDDIYRSIYWRADQSLSYGDLSRRAGENVRLLDINSFAYIHDLAALGTLAKQLANIDSGRTWRSAVHSAANLYLASHYGLRLTIQDTEAIAKAIDRIDADALTQTVSAAGSVTVSLPGHPGKSALCTRRLTAVVDSLSAQQKPVVATANDAVDAFVAYLARIGYEADVIPSLANLWDFIPYSFVVDWFLPIGDALEAAETRNYLSTFQVRRCFCTTITEFSVEYDKSTPELTRRDQLSYRYYDRECRAELPIPPMRVENPSGAFTHWVEGTALILQSL